MSRGQRTDGLEWGVASSTIQGEARSGDQHLVVETSSGTLLAVVDGIGHGDAAADAAGIALDALSRGIGAGVIPAMRRCHEALIGTRGVVVSMALVDKEHDTLTWIGVGNVAGVLLRADAAAVPRSEELLARGGVVGMQLPALHASTCSIVPGDLLALATDGVRPGFAGTLAAKLPPHRLAARLLAEHARSTDDALALVARYVGRDAVREPLDETPVIPFDAVPPSGAQP